MQEKGPARHNKLAQHGGGQFLPFRPTPITTRSVLPKDSAIKLRQIRSNSLSVQPYPQKFPHPPRPLRPLPPPDFKDKNAYCDFMSYEHPSRLASQFSTPLNVSIYYYSYQVRSVRKQGLTKYSKKSVRK